MAVNDKSIEMLAKSVEDLVKSMNGKNSFGSGQSSGPTIRMGRGGSSNGKSAGDQITALADNLEDLHKSMKSGGATLADHFRKMVKNINPLNDAFDKLEQSIKEAALTQSEGYTNSAKSMLAYIKSVKGNVHSIKRITSEYNELTEGLQDIADNHDEYIKDQAAYQKKLKKLNDLRLKIENRDANGKIQPGGITGGRPVMDGQLASWLRTSSRNPKHALNDNVRTSIGNMAQAQNGVNDVSASYLKDMTAKLEQNNKNLIAMTANFTAALGAAISRDLTKLPNFITNRIRNGFESNEFTQAFRLGVNAQDLNDMRAANRDVFNALQGFSSEVDLVKDGTLAEWADQSKRVGLVGKEALVFTQNMMRSAYDTGRKFDTGLQNTLTRDAQVLQQAFGGSIEETGKMLQDYSGQMYNVSRFAMAENKQQEEVIQKELTMRMLHTKYMGFELEYMKQQQQMQHNSAMGDIVGRVKSAFMGNVGAQMMADQTGMSLFQAQSLMAMNDKSGREVTDPKIIKAAQEAQIIYAKNKTASNNRIANTLDPGSVAQELLGRVAMERVAFGEAGVDQQGIVDAGMGAAARNKVRGDISFNDYVSQMNEQADRTDASITRFEEAVMEFSESSSGFGGLPGAAVMGAAGGFGFQLFKYMIGGRIMKAAGNHLFPTATRTAGQGATAVLARSNMAGGPTSPLKSVGFFEKLGLKGMGVAGAAKTAGKFGGKLIPGLGLGLGTAFAANRVSEGDHYGAALEMGSGIASTVPVFGTAAALAMQAGITGRDIAKSNMNKHNGKLFDAAMQMITSPGTIPARLGGDYLMRNTLNSNAGIAPALDAAGYIKRDADGNAIDANGKPIEVSLLEELVDLTKKTLGLAEEDSTTERMRVEKEAAIATQQKSVKQHMENLASTYTAKFTVG